MVYMDPFQDSYQIIQQSEIILNPFYKNYVDQEAIDVTYLTSLEPFKNDVPIYCSKILFTLITLFIFFVIIVYLFF